MTHRRLPLLLACAMTIGWSAAQAGASSADAAVDGVWQHHKTRINYAGATTLYTCSGLQSQVRLLLESLGARPGAKVMTAGCLGRRDSPAREISVFMQFDTVLPTGGGAQSPAVPASWTPLRIEAQRPSFMREGDCELVQQMKDVIVQNFSLRGLSYSANCLTQGQIPDSYLITGEVLRAAPAAAKN